MISKHNWSPGATFRSKAFSEVKPEGGLYQAFWQPMASAQTVECIHADVTVGGVGGCKIVRRVGTGYWLILRFAVGYVWRSLARGGLSRTKSPQLRLLLLGAPRVSGGLSGILGKRLVDDLLNGCCIGLGWEDVLPYSLKSEDHHAGNSEMHRAGADKSLLTCPPRNPSP